MGIEPGCCVEHDEKTNTSASWEITVRQRVFILPPHQLKNQIDLPEYSTGPPPIYRKLLKKILIIFPGMVGDRDLHGNSEAPSLLTTWDKGIQISIR